MINSPPMLWCPRSRIKVGPTARLSTNNQLRCTCHMLRLKTLCTSPNTQLFLNVCVDGECFLYKQCCDSEQAEPLSYQACIGSSLGFNDNPICEPPVSQAFQQVEHSPIIHGQTSGIARSLLRSTDLAQDYSIFAISRRCDWQLVFHNWIPAPVNVCRDVLHHHKRHLGLPESNHTCARFVSDSYI